MKYYTYLINLYCIILLMGTLACQRLPKKQSPLIQILPIVSCPDYYYQAKHHMAQNNFDEAIKQFNQSLKINQKQQSILAANDLIGLGDCFARQALYNKAIEYYLQALVLIKNHFGTHHTRVALTLNGIASLYYEWGDYANAETYALQAINIDKHLFGPVYDHDIVRDMNLLAVVYDAMGKYDQANDTYQTLLSMAQKQGLLSDADHASIINNIAGIAYRKKAYTRAKQLYEQALQIDQSVPDNQLNIARDYNNLGVIYKIHHMVSQSEACYLTALSIYKQTLGDSHPFVAAILNNLSELYILDGKSQKADILLQKALIMAEAYQANELIWHIQDTYRAYYDQRGMRDMAIFFGKLAVRKIQSMHEQLTNHSQDKHVAFVKSKSDVFKALADLLIQAGRLPEAQQVIQMMKQDEYIDFMKLDHHRASKFLNTNQGFTRQEQAQIDEYQEEMENAAQAGKELFTIQQKEKPLKDNLRAIQIRFSQYLDRLRYALTYDQKEKLKYLSLIQDELKEFNYQAIAIHYLITKEVLHIIITTPTVQITRPVHMSDSHLNQKINSFYVILQQATKAYMSEARELYDILFAPIQKDIRLSNPKILLISLDGALRYIPIGAIHDGQSFLAEQYGIAIYTQAARGNLTQPPSLDWYIAGLGLTKPSQNFCALPYVKDELDYIVKETNRLDENGAIPGKVWIDDRFTKDVLLSIQDDSFSIIHIASHFHFMPGNSHQSFLLIGDQTIMTLQTIEQTMKFSNIDLLTISACETAKSSLSQGDEIESFAVQAQYKGAKSVIASLWKVSDASTGLFMQAFYDYYSKHPTSGKANAIKVVQSQFIQKAIKPSQTYIIAQRSSLISDKDRSQKQCEDFSHPYFWAPFILIGNWL